MTRPSIGVVLALALGLVACGTAAAPPPPVLTVPGSAGSDMRLEIVDETGELVNAVAVSGEALATALERLRGPITATPGAEANDVRVVWLSFSCETIGRMTIARPNVVTMEPAPFADCDGTQNHRAVDLIFRGPVDVSALRLELKSERFNQEKG